MKKKLLSMMLALSMVLTLLPGTAFAGSVTFDYVDGKWTVSGESGSYTVDGTSITYTITLGTSSVEIKANRNVEGKVDTTALPDGLTDAQKDALGNVTVRSKNLGLLPRDHEDIAKELMEAGRSALEKTGSAGDKNASVDLGLCIEITDAEFDKNDWVTFLALEITAVYTVTVDGEEPESSVLTFEYPIELTVAVPEGMLANGANVSIKHSKDGSSYHFHKVNGIDRTNNTVTFISTDGLSPFTISITQPSGGSTTPSTPAPSGPSNPSGGNGGGSSTPSTPSTPDDDVIIDDEDVPLADMPLWFIDVKADDWFNLAVKYVFYGDLMSGISDDLFDPYTNTTRGMIVTVLHRLEGTPEAETTSSFLDVELNTWYTEAVAWAEANGIVSGYSSTEFRPKQQITREELVAILHRYAKYKDYDVSDSNDLSAFVDRDSVSDWALADVKWSVGANMISGKGNGVLDPIGGAKRAEFAQVMMQFCEKFSPKF